MTDSLIQRRPEDPQRININQQWEVEYWCDLLGCTESQLRAAVRAVGPMVKDVKAYLGK